MSSNKEKYLKFCEQETHIPIFNQPWWLDATCGKNNWDVVLYEKGGNLYGALPFYKKSTYGMTILTSPKFTQTLGPWLKESKAKYAKRLGKEKEIMQGLVDQLPKHSAFFQAFHHSIKNWLPFYWRGFEQTTKYTYVLEDLTSLDYIWNETNANIKTDIRKASKLVTITNDITYEEFYRIISLTYKRQNLPTTYSFQELKSILDVAFKKNKGKFFCAIDESGKYHAVAFIVWDNKTSYYLIGGADPELRNSGSASLCVWEAIKFSATVSESFDFEGSMVEGIERFFRGFGGRQRAYSRVSKFNSLPLGILYYIKKYRSGKI